MRNLIKNFLFALLLLPGLASAQQLINCSTGVPCDPTTGPAQTGTGDPFWKSFGKVNANNTTVFARDKSVNVYDFGAKGNTKSYLSSTMSIGSAVLTNSSAGFVAADVGKQIIVDNAGAAGAPLITTIAGFSNSTTVTLSATASVAVPYFYETDLQVAAHGTGCAPGDTINATGGSSTTTAVAKVSHCDVESAAINAAGSGGTADNGTTTGTCVVYGTTGSGGQKFALNVTITAGAITAIGTFRNVGLYSTNPTSIGAEPVTGCVGLTSATLNLTMGVRNLQPSVNGVYSVKPSNPVSQGAASGSEAGVTWTGFWVTAGTTTFGTDDTAAFTAAINQAISIWKTGSTDACVYIPAGHYFVSSPLPTFYQGASPVNGGGVPGCVRGEDRARSLIYMSPALNGDLFSWSRSFNFSSTPLNGPSVAFSTANVQGARISDLSIFGDRSGAFSQNAFEFFDENQLIDMRNVDGQFINGSFLRSGYTLNSTNAYIAESVFTALRCFSCGNSTHPVIDVNTVGTGENPNELDWDNVNIFAPYGQGFWLHNGASYMKKLRIEGLQWDPTSIGLPLLQIGDTGATGPVSQFTCLDCELIDPYINAAGLLVTGGSGALQPYGVQYWGTFVGGTPLGRGVQLDFIRTSAFHIMTTINAWDYAIQTAGTPNVGQDLDFDIQTAGAGEQGLLTSNAVNIGAGNVLSLNSPVMRRGLGGNQVAPASVQANYHDQSGWGGNAPGLGAVDMQTARNNATQAATGTESVISGGINNLSSNSFSVVGGGNGNNSNASGSTVAGGVFNNANGTDAWVPGGTLADTHTRYAAGCAASSDFAARGDGQQCWMTLLGTGASASAFRLTSDKAAAGSANCINIANNTGFAIMVDIMAFDHTTVTKNESWNGWAGLLTRGANAASTAVVLAATPTPLTNGTLTGSAISVTADTTQGCLNVSFTPPTANTDTWNVVARVTTVEVQ